MFRVVFILVVLLSSASLYAQSKDNEIYIALDNSVKSNIFRSELTRDWLSGKHINSTCYALDNKMTELKGLVYLIDINNPNERVKYHTPLLDKYPMYKTSLYSEFREFPEECYLTSSFPLLTVYSLSKSKEDDIALWRQQYREMVNNYNYEYSQEIVKWAINIKNLDLFKIKILPYETIEQAIIRQYAEEDGFPRYVLPKQPQQPRIIPMPWEKSKVGINGTYGVFDD